MKVMALDLSLRKTGVCDPDGETSIVAGRACSRGDYVSAAHRLVDIRDAIAELIGMWDPDLIIVEGYSYGSPHQAHPVGELGGVIRAAMIDRQQTFVLIAPTQRAKYATGKGNANKSAVMLAVGKRFPDRLVPASDDEADALVLWAMAQDHYGTPVVKMPATHRVALDSVEWPF